MFVEVQNKEAYKSIYKIVDINNFLKLLLIFLVVINEFRFVINDIINIGYFKELLLIYFVAITSKIKKESLVYLMVSIFFLSLIPIFPDQLRLIYLNSRSFLIYFVVINHLSSKNYTEIILYFGIVATVFNLLFWIQNFGVHATRFGAGNPSSISMVYALLICIAFKSGQKKFEIVYVIFGILTNTTTFYVFLIIYIITFRKKLFIYFSPIILYLIQKFYVFIELHQQKLFGYITGEANVFSVQQRLEQNSFISEIDIIGLIFGGGPCTFCIAGIENFYIRSIVDYGIIVTLITIILWICPLRIKINKIYIVYPIILYGFSLGLYESFTIFFLTAYMIFNPQYKK